MKKNVVTREDGRYVIFYSFDAPMPDVQTSSSDADASVHANAATDEAVGRPGALGEGGMQSKATTDVQIEKGRREGHGDRRV